MYLALYRKWRPKNFDDVISQPHITSTLKQEIRTGHIAHAYLFTGSRGTGKTTCAKIFAKAVNCLQPKDGEPCGTCDICRGLEDGTILDVDEMDGASNNRVDDIRVLREEATFTPVSCRYRVYIIDEVHMLSTSAFNALLKIMEEPPAHVIFILATTEVHKVPATIISRCQRFDFHRIRTKDIQKRLLHIAEKEAFTLTPDAAHLIARCADGAMRDALSLLDQVAARSQEITEDTVATSVGIASQSYLLSLHHAIEQKDPATALKTLQTLHETSKDLGRLLEELIHFYRNILVEKSAPGSDDLIVASKEEYQQIQEIARSISYHRVLEILSALQDCSGRLATTGNKRLELEICLIQLTTKKQEHPVMVSKSSKESANESVSEQKNPTPPQKEKTEPIHLTPSSEPVTPPDQKNSSSDVTVSNPSTEKRPIPLSCWPDILEHLKEKDLTGMLSGFLSGSSAYTRDDCLYIRSPNPVVADKIAKKKDLLAEIIQQHTGQNYRILLKGSPSAPETTSPLEAMMERAKQEGVPIEHE